MASVKELMEGNKRFKKQSSYAQTNLSPTSVKNAVGRSDVGGSAYEMSQFLGAMMKATPQALDAHNRAQNEKNEKLKKQGYLEYKNAKPSSLKAFRENSPLSENPHYKWGTETADAEMVLQKKANSYEQEYNEWKFNKPMMGDPEDLEKEPYPQTHEEFNKAWIERNSPDLGKEMGGLRNDIIMGESFWPGMDAVMAAKAKDHAQYEAQIYKEETERTRSSSYATHLDDPGGEKELLKKSFESMETIIANEESIEKELSLLERFAFGNTKLDKEDMLKGDTTPLQRDLIAKVFGQEISTGGQPDPSPVVAKKQPKTPSVGATTIMGQSFKNTSSLTSPQEPPIVLEQSTCENIFSDYKLQTEMGQLYVKPVGDITTVKFKEASHYPDLVDFEYEDLKTASVEVDASSGKGKRMQNKLKKTEVSASSGKGKRMQNKLKKTEVAEAPQDEVKNPVHKVQTWGVMSYMNEAKTAEFLPSIQSAFDEAIKGVLSDSSLPKEALGSFEANKWQGTGRLQIQFKMPPKHILDQYPEANKVNEELMQGVMEKLEITTPLTNEGMI